MNFQHQSRQQDLEEKKLIMEQLKLELVTKEEALQRIHEIDQAAKQLASNAAGKRVPPATKAIAISDGSSSEPEDEEELIPWSPSPDP